MLAKTSLGLRLIITKLTQASSLEKVVHTYLNTRNHRASYVDEPSEWALQLKAIVNAAFFCYNNILSWQGGIEVLCFHSYKFSLSTVLFLHTLLLLNTRLIKYLLLLNLSQKSSRFFFKYKCIYCIKSCLFHVRSLYTSCLWRGSDFYNT